MTHALYHLCCPLHGSQTLKSFPCDGPRILHLPATVRNGMLSFQSLVTLARKVCSTNLPSFHLNLQVPLTSFSFCLLCSGSLWIISFESSYTHFQGFDHFLSIYISLPPTLMKGGICFLAWIELLINVYFTEFLKEGEGNRAWPFAPEAIVSSFVFTLALLALGLT